MNPTQTNIEDLKQYQDIYSKIDLTFLDFNFKKIHYYLYKFDDFPYRSFCTLQQHVNQVYDANIRTISAVVGYPFTSDIRVENSTLQKCQDIEVWFEAGRVLRSPEKLFKTLRQITLKAHAAGVRVRAVTELSQLRLETINEWIDVCKTASVDHIQTGYGLTAINEDWIPELKEKLGDTFKLKIVGDVNSITKAKRLIENGADIIGSSTI